MQVRNMARCALLAALTALCAWLSIPVPPVRFTLQTFAIALGLLALGGKWGMGAVGLYLLLGIVGLPVFSGFRGGPGALLGTTGGYLSGFLACALVYWLLTALFPSKKALAMAAGLLTCYCFGTVWYYNVYIENGNAAGLWLILAKCVLPYLLPDGIKLLLALVLAKKLRRFVY